MDLSRRDLLKGVAIAATASSAELLAAPAPSTASSRLAASAAAVSVAGRAPVRQRLLLDFDWKFKLGHAQDPERDFGFGRYQMTYAKAGSQTADAARADFDDGSWQPVQLPHDWAVGLPFQPSNWQPEKPDADDPHAAHGYKPIGRDYPASSVGWYRRKFRLTEADRSRRLLLEFDGVFRDCTVFVNGYIVARHDSGYLPLQIDISDFAQYDGDNVIAVRVDASLGEGWFYEGAGIYRHVWLSKTDPLHIGHDGVVVRSRVKKKTADVSVLTEVCLAGTEASAPIRSCRLLSTVVAPDGRVLAQLRSSAITLAAGECKTIAQELRFDNPQLWSPDTPLLYQLITELEVEGRVVDDCQTAFGIRTVVFDPGKGLLLNGERLEIKGTCNHQDHAGVGTAIPDRLHAYRIERLKEMGSNAFRCSHNPPSVELLDICDRLGMLVIDETRRMSSDDQAMQQLASMIRRDRNHPCVVLWSLGNEEPQQGTERGARIVRRMRKLARELDPTRACTVAMDKAFGEGISKEVEVLGFNYRAEKMGPFHDQFPDVPILGSETGSTVCTRGEYRRDDQRGYLPAYDTEAPWWASTARAWYSYFDERPFIAGGFVWTGFDYRGEPTPFNRWPNVASQFGIMDSCGFAKDNFYYYQSRWRREPVLHLFPHWNWSGQEGKTIDVWCHSNLDQVELLVNGKSVGRQELPRNGYGQWQVPYVPGVIEARGYRNGELVLNSKRETTGPAKSIRLLPDRAMLQGDGEDVGVIQVEVVDEMGRSVPTANHLIRFEIRGAGHLLGVGNGDPTSHESDKQPQRHLFNGLCQLIVQSQRNAGAIEIVASSEGLAPTTLVLTTNAATPRPSA